MVTAECFIEVFSAGLHYHLKTKSDTQCIYLSWVSLMFCMTPDPVLREVGTCHKNHVKLGTEGVYKPVSRANELQKKFSWLRQRS